MAGPMGQAPGHRLMRMPPTSAVAEVLGSSQGKRASAVARQCGGRQRTCPGERFWARGSAVSTVGLEEAQRRASIQHQDQLDAQGSEESGAFSERGHEPWQP